MNSMRPVAMASFATGGENIFISVMFLYSLHDLCFVLSVFKFLFGVFSISVFSCEIISRSGSGMSSMKANTRWTNAKITDSPRTRTIALATSIITW